ncbi:Aspartokinase [subsurface metagenome]
MNKIIVQKYGGSSVASIERVKRIAEKIVETAKDGGRVVVVVSAMGKTTDDLIKMAGQITSSPNERELDMLISTGEQVSIALLTMAIHALGWDAISFTGMQAGIVTNAVHTKAKVTAVNHKKLKSALEKGKIVIVAGFQGIDANGDITTLGRGGSDTTAIALAAQLEADKCEIYTDVEGVFTADPRIVRTARRIPVISYDEMAEMASLGARVMHYRAIDLARNYKVKILVKSSFIEGEGTLIKEVDQMLEKVIVRGVTQETNVGKIVVQRVPDVPGVAYKLFKALAEVEIIVDMIIQSAHHNQVNDIAFTVALNDFNKAIRITKHIAEEIGAKEVISESEVAKVSIVGAGITSDPAIAARMFGAMAKEGVNIDMISTSGIKISCLISHSRIEDAVKAIHKEFNLDEAGEENEKI